MANVLKVTQSIPGYDSPVRSNTSTPVQQQNNIPNAVNPGRVARTDDKNEYSQNSFLLAANSNFEKFVQNLKNQPDAMESLAKLFMTEEGTQVTSGIGENFAQEISQFMELFSMETEGDLMNFLKSQFSTQNGFTGVFSQAVYQMLSNSSSVDLKTALLEFAKKASDFQSSDHVLNNIENLIGRLQRYMLKEDGTNLAQLAEKLSGNQAENVKTLKQDIIPFLGRYVMKTNDIGKFRDMVTYLTLLTSRYENGGQDGVWQSFQKALGFGVFREKLGSLTQEQLLDILKREQPQENAWSEKFISMMEKSLKGEYGFENRQVFQNLMTSLLNNESVYMPLMHMMIPVNYQGKMMFSELWVDPDSEEKRRQGAPEDGRMVKGLVKFDIDGVGYFDLVFRCLESDLSIDLHYPESLEGQVSSIQKEVTGIVERNGWKAGDIKLVKSREPLALTDVFPQIYERKNSVNVRV